MRTGSLFSGYDGLGLAVDELFPGNTREWFCEWDDAPSKILSHHWPTVPNFRDVTKVDWSTVPPVDILTGGFPCQPFSAAGRREGQNDERHLWPYVLEAIRALRPKYTLLENVAGLRSIGDHVDEYTFRCVCGWFGGRGGVHYSQVDESGNRHGHPGSDRHGDEGRRSTQEDADRVFGNLDHADASQPEAFGRDDMDGHGRRSSIVPESRSAASSIEGRAGVAGIEDRGDPDVAPEDRETRPSPLDPGSFGPVPEDLSADHGTEQAGANASGAGSGRWGGDCPACGRTLGDRSSGSVFRSGMGTIFRDLASLGLHVRWTSIRASDIGAPHHRERIFILVTDPSDTAGHGEWSRSESDEGAEGTPYAERGRRDRRSVQLDGSSVDLAGNGAHPAYAPDVRSPSVNDCAVCDATRAGRIRVTGRGSGSPLPTDAEVSGFQRQQRAGGSEAEVAVNHRGVALLPDTENDGRERTGQAWDGRTGSTNGDRGVEWGSYAPAIRRWERLTRPAPSPTLPNSNGRPQLNAAFAEWMMGVPAGHVTNVPISRAHQLKAIGNGVCPPQAVAAYSSLLDRAVAA